ncbi:MAG: sodium-independent anion transporter, partial [Rhodoferax sp.]|nr:sodium-independent anion transporter [Rhodoferax sp.]
LRHKVETVPGLLALRVDESLFFANAVVVEDRIGEQLQLDPGLHHVLLICSAVNQIDATALEVLTELERSLAARGIVFLLAEVKGPVMDRLRTTDLGRRLEGRVFLSVHEAFLFARRRHAQAS